jgi:hypothetical protein
MIISAIPKLSDFARENDEIADKEIISEINFIYTGDSADNRNYETCPLNYKRAVWVNLEKITAIHKIRQEEKRKKAIEDAAKKNESKNKASKLKKLSCANFVCNFVFDVRNDHFICEARGCKKSFCFKCEDQYNSHVAICAKRKK